MSKELYLLIADTITAVKNEYESAAIQIVVEALADAFGSAFFRIPRNDFLRGHDDGSVIYAR